MTREMLIRELAKHIVKCNKENFDQMLEQECPRTRDEFSKFGVDHSTINDHMRDLLNDVVDAVEEEQTFVAELLFPQ